MDNHRRILGDLGALQGVSYQTTDFDTEAERPCWGDLTAGPGIRLDVIKHGGFHALRMHHLLRRSG